MSTQWEQYLERWTGAALIEPATAARIRAYEMEHNQERVLRWPILLAMALGGLLLGAGVLLFVAAHWDTLAPGERFGLALLLVALFHVGGASAAERFSALSSTLHAVGTICLGAGIFLAGQIFHLQEHWPGGVMLWALGAWIAFALLRDWPQAVLIAVLTPAWLGGEWVEVIRGYGWFGGGRILAEGALLLAITYLTALMPAKETPVRHALAWIGAIALIPATVFVAMSYAMVFPQTPPLPESAAVAGWVVALGTPLVVAWWLRREGVWLNVIAALWVVALGAMGLRVELWGERTLPDAWREVGVYGVCVVGAVGLIAWGLKEGRKERINLGIAGFALTVLTFYFSSVMDKLGRSASLVGLGLLFLVGGWLLEKTRRRLVARLEGNRV